jgi:serine O-acetyltransferase
MTGPSRSIPPPGLELVPGEPARRTLQSPSIHAPVIDLEDIAMFEDLLEDVRRCGLTPSSRARELMLNSGMWAVIGYRFRRRLFTSRMPRPVRWLLNVPSVLAQLFAEVTTGIQLPSSAAIGPGLYIPHAGCIVVNSRAVIGSHCTIAQGVTIGHGGGGGKPMDSCPVIGDRVYMGPGSIIIGPITIGDDALIGAGAVVIRSIPSRGVAVGNPARVISRAGSFDLIEYPGLDDDPARKRSLAEAGRSGPTEDSAAVGSGTSSSHQTLVTGVVP